VQLERVTVAEAAPDDAGWNCLGYFGGLDDDEESDEEGLENSWSLAGSCFALGGFY